MKQAFLKAVAKWAEYWGDSWYPYLLLLSMVVLLFVIKENRVIRDLLLFTAVVGFVCFFPPTAKLIQTAIGPYFYFRIYWIFPAMILIAAAAAYLCSKAGAFWLKLLLTAACAVLFALGGTSQWETGNYETLHNRQKVPDEVAVICEAIRQDSEGKEVKVASNDQIATYIRVYEPAWYMPYGRKGRSAGSAERKELYALMEDGERDYSRLATIGISEGCSYLVVPLRDEESQPVMEQSGYQMITTVNHYGVFRLADKGEKE
ncbi:MAG: DUF4149 domain-containing protein [Blautia sp.]|nr:DUF4149 domain-containing protein [Blautia sp.]